MMASLFHCGQADSHSEAVASFRWTQDIRRVPKAAVTKSLDHFCNSGMDRERYFGRVGGDGVDSGGVARFGVGVGGVGVGVIFGVGIGIRSGVVVGGVGVGGAGVGIAPAPPT